MWTSSWWSGSILVHALPNECWTGHMTGPPPKQEPDRLLPGEIKTPAHPDHNICPKLRVASGPQHLSKIAGTVLLTRDCMTIPEAGQSFVFRQHKKQHLLNKHVF